MNVLVRGVHFVGHSAHLQVLFENCLLYDVFSNLVAVMSDTMWVSLIVLEIKYSPQNNAFGHEKTTTGGVTL